MGHLAHNRERPPVHPGGQIAQRLPRVAPVVGLPQGGGPGVQGGRVVRRDDERAVPVRGLHRVAEALFLECADLSPGLPVAPPGDVSGRVPGTDRGPLARARVQARDPQVLRLGVDDGVVRRVGDVDEAVTAAQPGPVAVENARLAIGLARSHPRAVVLKSAIDVVRLGHIDADPVVLADRQVRDVQPAQPAVVGDPQTAVVGLHHMARVAGVDPDEPVVPVQALGRGGEGAPSVVGEGVAVHHVDALVVARVDRDLAGVHGAGVPVAHEFPALAAVLRPVDARAPLGVGGRRVVAVALLDARVDDPGVAAVDRDADPSHHAIGKPSFDPRSGQPLPAVAPVHAAMECAAGAAAVEAPWTPPALVGCRVDDARVARVQCDVHDAGVLVHLQDGLPGGAAVRAAVETAFLVRAPEVAHRGDVDEIGVFGVQRDAADVAAVAQPHVRPALAAVRAPVDAVPPRRTLPAGALAGADPDDRRVPLVERDRTDRVGALMLEDGDQRDSVVVRLEDAAGGGRHVELRRVGLHDGKVNDPPAHDGGADVAGAQGVQLRGGDLGLEGRGGGGEEGGEKGQAGRFARDPGRGGKLLREAVCHWEVLGEGTGMDGGCLQDWWDGRPVSTDTLWKRTNAVHRFA